MRPVVVHIVHPVEVNRRLMQLGSRRGAPLSRFVLLMERAEPWAVDDIRMNADDEPVGVDDERGTAEERLVAMRQLERVLNSEAMAKKLQSQSSARGPVGEGLIEVLALLRTGRFLVCLHHLSTVSAPFIGAWLQLVDERARAGDVMAHVLRSRLVMFKKANMISVVFSRESAQQVMKTLEFIK
ncbi:type IVB secretion system protein IcmW [Paracidovorax wautersii]|uniref:Uncharacterized protein n=1 Tax=Paracidovorax wautersii TaxID=1177982 RepID=A0A1I2HP82_9BURK|nr:hypothetical protein [Paracidovorax wautersii]SFF31502.1 hypothetical protein SAMN04489711_1273 [Paracidovorax wautersii]